MKILILFLCIIGFSRCQVLSPTADSPKLTDTNWKLIAIKQKPTNLKDNAFITFNEKDSKIAGKAACNSFFGEYVLIRNTITFEGIGSTKMFCEGLMDEESQILTSLEKIKRFEVKANMLYLYSSDELLLTFKR